MGHQNELTYCLLLSVRRETDGCPRCSEEVGHFLWNLKQIKKCLKLQMNPKLQFVRSHIVNPRYIFPEYMLF